jgi:Protein of unknown function (DUF3575)
MKNISVVLLLMFTNCIYSQDLKEKNWILKLNAMQLIDIFSYPTIQISAERKINPYFSINTEIGYQFYNFNERNSVRDTIFLKQKGFKTNIEGRLYLFKLLNSRTKSNRGELYVGLQLFYRENQSTNLVNYSPKSDSTKVFTDVFGTKRKAFGVNITIGHQITIFKRIVLEPFVGIGLMNKKIRNSDIEYNKEKDFRLGTGLVPFFQGRNLEESSGTDLNLCAGFRIGYKL